MIESGGRANPEADRYSLIVYVHVPKTAGSTVSKLLGLCTPRGRNDSHFIISQDASFLNLIRNFDWIGGHNERDVIARSLIWLDRRIDYFASVREPVAQLVSLLNHTFQRRHRGDYYDLHNPDEQELDAEVMSIDYSKPDAIMALLSRHANHYLNIQSRYVLGADFDRISDHEIARRLASYRYVATEANLSKLYKAFGFARLPEGANEIRENAAKPHFDARVFDGFELRQFLADRHKHDFRLYSAVQATSWPAERRCPFRPAFVEQGFFTFENFNEEDYLASNPDVADSIAKGLWKSGRAHFEAYGYRESRKLRRWVFPAAESFEAKSIAEDFCVSSTLQRLREHRKDRARTATQLQLPQRALADTVG